VIHHSTRFYISVYTSE